jgi:hypothetical protein
MMAGKQHREACAGLCLSPLVSQQQGLARPEQTNSPSGEKQGLARRGIQSTSLLALLKQ